MRYAKSFNARTSGRVRALLAAVIVTGALVVSASILVFGTSPAAARSNIFIPYWNTAMSHNVPHWDDGCECYNGYDSIFDGFDRDFGLFPPDNVLALSVPITFGPSPTRAIAIRYETFGSTHIKELHEFQPVPHAPKGNLKLVSVVKAPTGVNGASVTTQSSAGTAATQIVTWYANGVPKGSPVSVNIEYYIDFAAQQKNTCANKLLSPPIAVVPTLVNPDGTTSAGRPVLEPCTLKVTHKIPISK